MDIGIITGVLLKANIILTIQYISNKKVNQSQLLLNIALSFPTIVSIQLAIIQAPLPSLILETQTRIFTVWIIILFVNINLTLGGYRSIDRASYFILNKYKITI
jgi:hypothetical protein